MSKSKLIDFFDKAPRRVLKKDKFLLILVASSILTTIYIYNYVLNNPIIPFDLPTMHIKTNQKINEDEYVNCTIELDDKDSSEPISRMKCNIRYRGRLNLKFPKKGYRLEFIEPQSLLGMRKDDDWLLMAMWNDLPSMQIKLAFDLWRSLEKYSPTAILPDSEYICLYINGEFQGLFLLAEKIDRSLYDLDDAQNNLDSSLMFQSVIWHTNFYDYNREDWEQDWPNEDDGIYIMEQIMNELILFVRDSSDEQFFDPETGVYSFFNKNNLIDFFIYNVFINHEDFWAKNYYIVRNTYPNKFFLVPWDFDRCFGQRLERHLHNIYEIVRKDPDYFDIKIIYDRNILYRRLLESEEFKEACNERWIQIRNNLWTEEFILDELDDMYEEIKDILEYDSKKWYSKALGESCVEDIVDCVDWLYDWIPQRLEFCDQYFNEF